MKIIKIRPVTYTGTCSACDTTVECDPREVSDGWACGARFAKCPRCGHSIEVSKKYGPDTGDPGASTYQTDARRSGMAFPDEPKE